MGPKTLWWILGGALVLSLLLVATGGMSRGTFMMRATTGSSGSVGAPMMADYAYDSAAGEERATVDAYALSIAPGPAPTAGQTAAEVDQKIIKTGFLDLTVDDVQETVSKASALAAGAGGYVQESDVSEREDGTRFGNLAVRVPSERFETTMAELKTYATAVNTESSQGQDVTEEFTDLEAQLRNAKAQEEEYLRILGQAETVEEILMVQSYLSSARYTIESLEGRIQYLENRTSYSTISIVMSEETAVSIPTKDFRLGSTARDAGRALVVILQNLAAALVWIVVLGGGLLLPLGLLAWGAKKILAKRRSR